MSKPEKLLPWIDWLPEVGEAILADRTKLALRLQEADRMEEQARAIRAEVRASCVALNMRIQQQWTPGEIARARAKTEKLGNIGELHTAIRAMDGLQSPLDAISLYHEHVIKQHNLIKGASNEELRATPERALAWWNLAVSPMLDRMGGSGP